MFNWFKRYLLKERCYKTLQDLTDRELKDIGIHRSNIRYLVENGHK